MIKLKVQYILKLKLRLCKYSLAARDLLLANSVLAALLPETFRAHAHKNCTCGGNLDRRCVMSPLVMNLSRRPFK